jgi:hypothetical protein
MTIRQRGRAGLWRHFPGKKRGDGASIGSARGFRVQTPIWQKKKVRALTVRH